MSSAIRASAFVHEPLTAGDFLGNAFWLLSKVNAGKSQVELSRTLGLCASIVSNLLTVSRRWPSEAIRIVLLNDSSFPPQTLAALAREIHSDLRGGDPRKKTGKPSIVATLKAMAEGQKPLKRVEDKFHTERLLIRERTANHELRQRIRDLEAQLAAKDDQPLTATTLSHDLAHVREVLLHKYSARVVLDTGQKAINIFCGTEERFNAVIEHLMQ